MASSKFASGFAGFLLGVVTGLGIAAGAAVFITNSPIPFIEKVQKVTADVDPSLKLAGGIDPNRLLNDQQEQPTSAGTVETKAEPPAAVEEKPAATTPAPEVAFWLLVGTYKSETMATERKGILAMSAVDNAHIEKVGNLWRVRIGPFTSRQKAAEAQATLKEEFDIKTTLSN